MAGTDLVTHNDLQYLVFQDGDAQAYSPPPIDGLIAATQSIWDFLFGAGHAGSCGIFRDQYFQVKGVVDPILDQAVSAFTRGTINWNPIPTAVMAVMGPSMTAVIDVADSQFDKFKGKNLLGQTMFASRIHLLLFKRWVGAMCWGTAEWAEQRVGELSTTTANLWTDSAKIWADLGGIHGQLTSLGGNIGQIPAILSRMGSAEAQIGQIRNSDIPALSGRIQGLSDFLYNNLTPQVARQGQQLIDILTNGLPSIRSQLNTLQQTTDGFKSTYATKAELESVRQQMLNCCQAAQGQTAQLQQQINTILGRLGVNEANIGAALNQIQSLRQLVPTLATQQQIAALQGQINWTVQTLNIMTPVSLFYPLRDRVLQIERQLPALAQQADVVALRKELTNIESLLPSFAKQADFAVLKQRIDTLYTMVAQRDVTLDGLQGQIYQLQGRDDQLQGNLNSATQRLTRLEGLQSGYAKASDIPLLQAKISSLQQTVANKANIAQVLDLQKQIDFLRSGDQTLARDIATLKGQVAGMQQQLAQSATQAQVQGLQSQIDRLKLADQAQISLIQGLQSQATAAQQRIIDLTKQLQALQGQVGQLQDFTNKAIQQLQQVDKALQGQIGQITTNLQQQVLPTLARHTQQITTLEQQKVQTVLPAIANIGQQIVDIYRIIQQEIKPPLGQHGRDITYLINQFRTFTFPQINILIQTVSDIKYIFNSQITNITNRVTKIEQNFTTNVVNIIQKQAPLICKAVRECIQNSQQDMCEFGRRVWGRMAECWFEANSPDLGASKIRYGASRYRQRPRVDMPGSVFV